MPAPDHDYPNNYHDDCPVDHPNDDDYDDHDNGEDDYDDGRDNYNDYDNNEFGLSNHFWVICGILGGFLKTGLIDLVPLSNKCPPYFWGFEISGRPKINPSSMFCSVVMKVAR